MTNKNENTIALLNEIIRGIEEMKGEDINKIDLREIDNSPCEFLLYVAATQTLKFLQL